MSYIPKRGLYPIKNNQKAKEWSEPRIILFSFLAILLPSAILLTLPVFSVSGLSFVDALFTATSAISVTGLGVVDTGTHFTISGKILLMFLMQIGGLGQMTLSAVLLYVFGLRLSLRQQALAKEALGQEKKVNLRKLIKSIICFALIAELIGMIILSFRWVPDLGLAKGLFYAAFHSISAFNNAGFSLFSDSLMGYVGDPLVIFTLSCLFIGGGLGFTVIVDLVKNSSKGFSRLQLHTKIMIIATPTLLLIGTLFFYVLEYNNPSTLASLSVGDKWLAAFFQSASARTAGFNSVDLTHFTQPALFIMIILMLIGAGSTSTGGGLKVSTITVAAVATWTFLRQKKHVVMFKRTVGWPIVTKSLAIIVVSGSLLSIAMFTLMLTEQAGFDKVMFEVISAFATVGLTAGLTAELSEVGKCIMVIVMVIGRIGPLTLAYMLARPETSCVKYPEDTVLTG
ncbi:TrkH family potassium uptake protein [Aliivibrio sp. S4TY2]|uniref:TrkH family potassium uptake protein n=1 Tax=unclassified Aliivibrio TaxID=2645654 RepID=UPI0023793A9C|nr:MULTISPECIES: TrkH family potassium uptake protein [unclassified Aliivibrio]MDD9156676.1 TrkH family potassium uptake protein [Aliivibrio sp. S4TY2]MDD9160162.1 TrkH family potassium uptake protein [Aliivibrio sp. S4TY1]MDD9164546.1 TrkH family potassium uptake protein [Aliivibrio sp. S4MY2]MDD9168585.1 TrkH family potassium uptake protein [Aliivibrio sp. S4MY4]MDD9184880.1 TrkH family potassium uptake protein [Aliivibrio sp. S4MY3]